jgi:hypothetical protein
MKYIVSVIFISSLFFASCSNKETPKITAFSPEAFAYALGDSSEVDASVRVKGFVQKEENGKYSATLAYDIDLVTPSNDTLKSLLSRVVDKLNTEKVSDLPLEAQFDLDSTYAKGNYQLIFNIKDAASGSTTKAVANFKLGE